MSIEQAKCKYTTILTFSHCRKFSFWGHGKSVTNYTKYDNSSKGGLVTPSSLLGTLLFIRFHERGKNSFIQQSGLTFFSEPQQTIYIWSQISPFEPQNWNEKKLSLRIANDLFGTHSVSSQWALSISKLCWTVRHNETFWSETTTANLFLSPDWFLKAMLSLRHWALFFLTQWDPCRSCIGSYYGSSLSWYGW